MIRRAGPGDLARVDLETKARPLELLDLGLVWLETLHADETGRILILDEGGFAGFAVIEQLYPDVYFLVNLAVTRPGRGDGARLIRGTLEVVFGELGAHRLFCDVAFDNAAGLKAFARAGFVQEGTMRQCWKRRGEWVDCHAFAMLAQEWRAAGQQGGQGGLSAPL